MEQLLACWLVIDDKDIPLSPRLIGKPGVGKTTLAYAAANIIKRDVYIYQCTMDTRPEDLLITPVIDKAGGIRYVASSLVTAMIRGQVCIFDDAILDYVVAFLQRAHISDERYTVRDGINIARYAAKRLQSLKKTEDMTGILRQAISMTLGDEALVYAL